MKTTKSPNHKAYNFLCDIRSKEITGTLKDNNGLVFITYKRKAKPAEYISYEDYPVQIDDILMKANEYCKKHNLTLWSY